MCVAVEAGVAPAIEGRQVGLAAADIVEQHLAVRRSKRRGDEPPHVLVAAETMCVQQDRPAVAQLLDVIALDDVHGLLGSVGWGDAWVLEGTDRRRPFDSDGLRPIVVVKSSLSKELTGLCHASEFWAGRLSRQQPPATRHPPPASWGVSSSVTWRSMTRWSTPS